MSVSQNRSVSRRARRLQRGLRSALRLESLENRVVFSGASPVAVNDLYEVIAEETLEVSEAGVLVNDSDADGDSLTAREFLGPKHGTLNFREDGTFEYTPNAGFSGMDGFVYQANDGTSDSPFAAVTIQVIDPNSAPTGVNDTYEVAEDNLLEVIAENGVLTNDTDEDGDDLSAELVDPPEHGTLELMPDGSFSYIPNENYFGTDAFTYRTSDGQAVSDLVVVQLTVSAVNDAPQAEGEIYEITEDEVLVMPAPALLANDSDVDNDSLQVVLDQAPEFGSLELQPDGGFMYMPTENFFGTDTFSYFVTDGEAESAAVTAEIVVTAVSDTPVANNDLVSTLEDEPLLIQLQTILENDLDPDGDPLVFELGDAPENGVLETDPDGNLLFTPAPDFSGTDAFTYRVSDGASFSDFAVVEIQVAAVNDEPLAADDAYSTQMDTALEIPAPGVLANDTDVEGDLLTATLAEAPQHGTVEVAEDGSFVYTPDSGFAGTDQFSYFANDAEAAGSATVVIEVIAAEQPPTAVNDSYSTTAGQTLTVDAASGILANDIDPNDDALSAELFRTTLHGTLVLNPDGSFEYAPEAGYEGLDSFIYRASDGTSQSTLAVVTLRVAADPQDDGEQFVGDPGDGSSTDDDSSSPEDGLPEDNSSEDPLNLFADSVDELLDDLDLADLLSFEIQCRLSLG